MNEQAGKADHILEADTIYAGMIRQGRFEELLEQFYRDEGENVFSLVLHTVGDHGAAQDLFQESFIKIHRYVRQLRTPESYRFWAYRIIVNTCKTWLRQQQKDRQRMGDPYDENDSTIEGGTDPAEQFRDESVRQTVQQALSRLAPDYRTVILLHYYHDYKYEEIAAILSTPLNTVKSKLHRGKQQLSKLLDRKKVEDAL